MTLALVAAGAATVLGGGLAATHAALSGGRPSGMQRLPDYRGADFQPQRAAFMDWPASRAIPIEQRLQSLAAAALADLGRAVQTADVGQLRVHGYHVAMVLPEYVGIPPDGLMQLVAEATALLGLAPGGVTVHACGAAGLAMALKDHTEAAGKTALLAIAADSFANEARLNVLNDASKLFNKHNPWGLIPGEAGAALLFVPDARDETHKALTVLGAGVAIEMVGEDDAQSSGYQGLTAACQTATRQVGPQIAAWDTDCNNARYRAAEFGYTALRLQSRLVPDTPVRQLASSFGDTGAASSALAVGLWWQAADVCSGPVMVTGVGQGTRLRGAIVMGQPAG